MFYLLVKIKSGTSYFLCQHGVFASVKEIMTKNYFPVLFSSKKEAQQAKRKYGHWPTYKIINTKSHSHWLEGMKIISLLD